MRKRIKASGSGQLVPKNWMDLETVAEIELTSEDPAHPIEYALLPGLVRGWKAAESGKQTIRIRFDEPQRLSMIYLVFGEDEKSRTQEFVLRWSRGDELPFEDIVRQQYNFVAGSSEVENYSVNLNEVKLLELEIDPSVGKQDVRASLAELRLR
jgi:hypothetical protein